jgi:hypothetical protein
MSAGQDDFLLDVVATTEAVYTTLGVRQSLFASVERMALGADADFGILNTGLDLIFGAASATDLGLGVGWMNVFFHGSPLLSECVSTMSYVLKR